MMNKFTSTMLLVLCFFTLEGCVNLRYYEGSVTDHFDGVRFYNKERFAIESGLKAIVEVATRGFEGWPDEMEEVVTDKPPSQVIGNKVRVSMVGHASVLIQTSGVNILTDPVWSDRVGPYSYCGPKRVKTPGIKFEDLPRIDIVVISHNHYDHMDVASIEKIWNKDKPFIVVPLGNDVLISRHNKEIKSRAIDWGEYVYYKGIKVNLEPAQHSSSRALIDNDRALWGAFVLQIPNGDNIYFAGDTAYASHFNSAGKKYGKFRLALLPIGAYDPEFFLRNVHMGPEGAVKAHIDLHAEKSIPIHFDLFPLSLEPFGEPEQLLEKYKTEYKIGWDKFKILPIGSYAFY